VNFQSTFPDFYHASGMKKTTIQEKCTALSNKKAFGFTNKYSIEYIQKNRIFSDKAGYHLCVF